MNTKEAVAAITELAKAYAMILEPRPNIQGPGYYEAAGILKAANAIAESIATRETDDTIPF